MPLIDPALRTNLVAGVTGGETGETNTAYDRVNKVVKGWSVRGVIVAASTTAADLKETADYVCDGTADQTEINLAIATGRPVLLLPGTFNISASVTNPAGIPFTLTGSGWGTILLAASGLNDYVIKLNSSTGEVRGARIGYLKVDGNAGVQTAGGGIWARGATQCLFEHLWIHRGYHAGLFLDGIQAGGFGHHNRFMHSLVDGGSSSAGEGNGIYVVSSDENFIGFVDLEDCGGSGGTEKGAIKDTAGLNTYLGGSCVNGLDGIRVKDTGRVRIQGWTFDGCGRDSIIISGYRCSVIGNTFLEGGQTAANTYSHLHINADANGGNLITGNAFTSPTAPGGNGRLRSFVRESGTAANNTVALNRFHVDGTLGTAKVERATLSGIWKDNSGYTTSASGTATIASGSTSVVVNHGLDITPTLADIHVTPTNTLGTAAEFWVSSPTSTQFTINVNVDPGATTATFAWQAGYGVSGGGGGAGSVSVTEVLGSIGTYVPPVPLGGGSSDVATFEAWLATTPAGATIAFGAGLIYLQASMVRYLPSRKYVWPGVDEPTTYWKVTDGTAMPATSGMWVPKVWDDNSTAGQLPVEFIHPCLSGNKANTTGGHHGLIMGGSHWYKIHAPYILLCRGDAIRLTNLAKDGTTVLGNDAADGDIRDVRLQENSGCGVRQVLSASVNAHMDVQLRGGRIWGCGESGVLGDRLNGWDISGLHFFTIQHFAIKSTDGWFDLGIHDNQIEDFGGAGGASFWAGISVKGYGGQGCSISHNRVRHTPPEGPEPGTGAMSYIYVEGAASGAMCSVDYNVVRGVNSPRAGVIGINYNASSGTMYVTGKGTNLVRDVAVLSSTSGTVTSTGTPFV